MLKKKKSVSGHSKFVLANQSVVLALIVIKRNIRHRLYNNEINCIGLLVMTITFRICFKIPLCRSLS